MHPYRRGTGRKTQEPQTPKNFASIPSAPHKIPLLADTDRGLGARTLGTHLADVPHGLALGGDGGVLGLLSLLSSLGGLLLLLVLLDGLLAGGAAGLGALGTLLLDHVQGSTNDGTLGLDGAARALLGDLLRDTLAVLATVQNGPRNAAGVLALEEKRLRLAVLEAEDLAVTTDVDLTLRHRNHG